MIPDFNYRGELPPGIYVTTLKEIEDRLVFNKGRKELFEGLKAALENLSKAGVPKVYIDGSFVTGNRSQMTSMGVGILMRT